MTKENLNRKQAQSVLVSEETGRVIFVSRLGNGESVLVIPRGIKIVSFTKYQEAMIAEESFDREAFWEQVKEEITIRAEPDRYIAKDLESGEWVIFGVGKDLNFGDN